MNTRAISGSPDVWLKKFDLLRLLNGLAGNAKLGFAQSQFAAVRARLPLFLFVNLAAAVISAFTLPFQTAAIIGFLLALTAAILVQAILSQVSADTIDSTRRKIGMAGALSGLCWAVLTVYVLSLTDAGLSPAWLPALIIAVSVVAYCLASLPSAALLQSGLPLSVLSIAVLHPLQWPGAALAVATICFVMCFATSIGAHYRLRLDLVQSKQFSQRQSEIISLLLKEFESGPSDWLWEANSKGELIYVTDALSELTGRPTGELLGKSLNQISGLPPHLGPWQTLHDLMNGRHDICEVEIPVRIDRKRRFWQITARPILSPEGQFLGYRGVGCDITEARNSRAALVQAKEIAERASAAKSQFLNVMSHELRTPLNAIIGFSEIMAQQREGPLGSPSYVDYAGSIAESSRQLQRIINDILDASRIDKANFKLMEQEVDAVELAQVAVRNCRQMADQKKVALRSHLGAVRAEIRGDLVRLKQILDNLLTNAIKFTLARGTVELTLREEQDGGLSFIIRDTGIGIEKKDLERVFEPFVQADVGTNRQFGGTGLGLPIARKLARAHGGEITLESSPGNGTTAVFCLPPGRVIRQAGPLTVARSVAAA